MAARFTHKIRSFIVNSFIDSLLNLNIIKWQQNTVFSEGTLIFYENNEYIAKNTGTSGSTPPTHISGTVSDGGINWIFVRQIQLNKTFAKNLYFGLGKKTPWTNENIPDDPSACDDEDSLILNNILTMLKIDSQNSRIACRNIPWTSGEVYSQYDSKKDPNAVIGNRAYTHPFYVINNNHIFKCINNNNNALSVVQPNNTSNLPFVLSDGYVWKYIASLNINDTSYITDTYYPINIRNYNDFSPQYTAQETAKPLSISTFKILKTIGTFPDNITVTLYGGSPTVPASIITFKNSNNTLRQVIASPSEPGEGYDLSSRVIGIAKKESALGQDATVGTITITDGVITEIAVDNPGTNYQNGAILLIYDKKNIPITEASVSVSISGGNHSVQQFIINDGGSGYSDDVEAYVIPNNAGALCEAIFAPKEGHGYNAVLETGANALIINKRVSSSGDYLLHGENNAIRQISLITDAIEKNSNNYLKEEMYIGPEHPSYGSGILNEVKENSGRVLYINNIKKIVRSESQEEDVSIVITF